MDLSNKTIKEKHAAWLDIIAEYPDMPIHKRCRFEAQESLHEFLREKIAWEENWLADFFTPCDDSVYRRRLCRRWGVWETTGNGNLYSTVEKALESLEEEYKFTRKDLGIDYGIEKAEIQKVYIDDYRRKDIWINSDLEVVEYIIYDETEVMVVLPYLHNIFIHIPVPFVKGDLLECDGKPYVLLDLPHWSPRYENIMNGKDSEVSGAFAKMFGKVYHVDEPFYPQQRLRFYDGALYFWELKYFTGKLFGNNRFLRFLSDFMKNGEKELCHLLYAFEKIKAQTAATDYITYPYGTLRYLADKWAYELEGHKKEAE